MFRQCALQRTALAPPAAESGLPAVCVLDWCALRLFRYGMRRVLAWWRVERVPRHVYITHIQLWPRPCWRRASTASFVPVQRQRRSWQRMVRAPRRRFASPSSTPLPPPAFFPRSSCSGSSWTALEAPCVPISPGQALLRSASSSCRKAIPRRLISSLLALP